MLSAEERALIWRFRSSLTADPRALTKVTPSVRDCWHHNLHHDSFSQQVPQHWAPSATHALPPLIDHSRPLEQGASPASATPAGSHGSRIRQPRQRMLILARRCCATWTGATRGRHALNPKTLQTLQPLNGGAPSHPPHQATTPARAVPTTQVLRCVDWGDAREARAAVELMARWAPIGLADALELLSPAFTNPEVGEQRCPLLLILSPLVCLISQHLATSCGPPAH